MSAHHDSEKKLDIATFALLPVALMLFVEMWLNHYAAPHNLIFISPYLLAFFIAVLVSIVVLWKGQICPGQRGRLTFVLKFLAVFAVGNLLYSLGFTPKHNPLVVANLAAVMLPFLYWQSADDEKLYQTLIYCALGFAVLGAVLYLAIYWGELPSMFNWVRGNNFAQLQLGILLAGWYLMLAKSRLDVFFKLLIQLALVVLVLNYLWTAFMLYQHWLMSPEMALLPYFAYFAVQFVIFASLAWLLLGKGDKQIKNPVGWTVATFLSMLYPFVNVI